MLKMRCCPHLSREPLRHRCRKGQTTHCERSDRSLTLAAACLVGLRSTAHALNEDCSTPMSAPTLSEAISQYGHDAYLITVGKDGPHTSSVSVDLRGNFIHCAIGPSAAQNIASEPNVS